MLSTGTRTNQILQSRKECRLRLHFVPKVHHRSHAQSHNEQQLRQITPSVSTLAQRSRFSTMSIPAEFWTTIDGLKDSQATSKDKLELLNKLVEISEKIPTFEDAAQIEQFFRRYLCCACVLAFPVRVFMLLTLHSHLLASEYSLCTRPKHCALHHCVWFGTTCVIQRS